MRGMRVRYLIRTFTMINITISDKSPLSNAAGCYVLFAHEGFDAAKLLKEWLAHSDTLLAVLEKREFTGKSQQLFCTHALVEGKIVYLILVGLGKGAGKRKIDIEQYRRAVARAVKEALKLKSEMVVMQLPDSTLFSVDPSHTIAKDTVDVAYLAQHTVEISMMASYHFDDFITDESRKETVLSALTLCIDTKHKKAASDGAKTGHVIGQAVNRARHWIDLPPSTLNPAFFASKAQQLAKEHDVTIQVFDEKQINKMGMGGLAGVSRGSDEDCRLVIVEYKAKRKTAPTIAFVGKGITFDSGGLSIKPADYMECMKDDMSGAAAVISAVHALSLLKPNVNVICLAPIAENLPSGKALKPGDIVTFYNGKTAEVRNTDAEGRLILADALSYAVKHYKLDAIIDIATLTGACAHALGPFYTGLMSQHDILVDTIQAASDRSGDAVWRLPMSEDYKVAIRSEVADLCNIGSRQYKAGAITAAHFLQNFVGDVPWVHLDIAGTAFDVPAIPYYRPGATGAGIRLLIDIAMNWGEGTVGKL
jgi:leucyl aminopeptidase